MTSKLDDKTPIGQDK